MLNSINIRISYFLSNPVSRFVCAFFAGGLLALSNPSFGFSFIAWFALVPLLILIKSSKSYTSCFFESLIFALTYNLISFSWLFTLHPLTWQGLSLSQSFIVSVLAWLSPSLFHTFLTCLFSLITRIFFRYQNSYKAKPELNTIQIFSIAFLWVVIHHKLALGLLGPLNIFSVPINFLVYSQYQNLWLIQIVNLIGAIGLELIIVAVNLVISNLFNIEQIHTGSKMSFKLNARTPYLGIANPLSMLVNASIVLLLVVGLNIYGVVNVSASHKAQSSNELSYAIAQANLFAEDIRGQGLNVYNMIDLHADITAKLQSHKDLVLWPEGVVSSTKDVFKTQEEPIKDYASVFVYGTYSRNKERSKIFNSIAVKDYYTSVDPQFYRKINLVPFGEYTPFLKSLPLSLQELARSAVGAGFDAASEAQEAIKTSVATIGSSICFELLFPELIRKQVLSGAEFIINLNDLSWFRTDIMKQQFLAVAVFRAVENSRDLLLAANAGYSAHINSVGELSIKSEPFKPGLFEGLLNKAHGLSVYSQYGW